MWYFPREGAVIVLLSNRGLYNPDRTMRQLARTLWKHIDVPAPRVRPPSAHEHAAARPDAVRQRPRAVAGGHAGPVR